MSFSAPRDVIQVSLGSSSNAVTAHSLNLQGLAATDNGLDQDGGQATCDAQTTHYLHQNHWVPRVLLVDEPTRFFVSPEVSQQASLLRQSSPQAASIASMDILSSASPFAIQPLDQALVLQHAEPQEWSQRFYQTSSNLAYSSHSRYYQEQEDSAYRASAENPRHVNWDDLGEEKPEEDPHQKAARLHRERAVWQNHTLLPLQHELSEMVAEAPFATDKDDTTSSKSLRDLHWMEYWMPPYSDRSKIALEYSRQSHLTPNWDSYYLDGSDSRAIQNWQEDVLVDGLRHLLEECDACQGIIITTEGEGIYAGLTTGLLQEIQEEVKSAGRIVFHISNPQQIQDAKPEEEEEEKGVEDTNEDTTSGWQPAHVKRLRQNLSRGLALYDFSQHADLVVPLELPFSKERTSMFEASAHLAMAIESCTLPIRLRNNSSRKDPRYDIGLLNAPFFGQGGGDSQWGTTAQRLSMAEYIMCLQPSKQYKIVELDAAMPQGLTNENLWQAFQSGTSIERDARMRSDGRDAPRFRARDVAPGGWLQDKAFAGGGGILSCLSPNPSPKTVDRSLHYNFALSTSVRPILHDDLSKYLTATVQGMGIQYRPERSMSTVLGQTLGQLTQQGGYGAGAYWKSLVALEQPGVAVLGNSTRAYSNLDKTAKDMEFVLSSRYRGYYQRDVMNGLLPEAEDCNEALEGCWDLRDVYSPPDGSGLLDDEVDIDI